MNRIAYTTFIAFIASILTLLAVNALTSETTRAANGGQVITLDELAEHDSSESCWKAIDGRVYDITEYIPHHPTPEHVIAEWCGKESTEAWEGIRGGGGHSASAEAMLANYLVGVLEGHEDLLEEAATESEAATETTAAAPRAAADSPASDTGLNDGSYYAELDPDQRGWIALMELTIVGGQVAGVHFDEVQRDDDGQVTDNKLHNYGYSARWRNGVPSEVSGLSAFPAFAEQLRQTADAEAIDGISGATATYDVFTELATQLLDRARN